MQCKCGGSTQDRQTVENKQVVVKYARCIACGQIYVWWKSDKFKGKR